jgi:hypothetical protein
MIIVNRDGSLTTEDAIGHVARRFKDIIEVPEDLVAQQPDLIDRIFTFAFDVLALQTIDVRIHPVSQDGHPATSRPVRETPLLMGSSELTACIGQGFQKHYQEYCDV